MSDEERELTPQQEAEIGRLLADARATEPIPPDVAARLDQVLIGLGEERGGAPLRPARGPSALELAARRRRRATSLLVAATAVIVVGVGVGQLVADRGGDDAASSGEVDSSVTSGEADSPAAGGADEGAAPEPAEGESARITSPPARDGVGLVSSGRFAADAGRLRATLPSITVEGDFVSLDPGHAAHDLLRRYGAFSCDPADWGPGALVPVLYDGTPAVLAYRPAEGDSQVVDLLQCGSGDVVRSTTLPAD